MTDERTDDTDDTDDRTAMTPEEVVGAIWDRWERDLADWDLEGATANAEAHRLAVEVVAGLMDAGKLTPAVRSS